MKYKLINVMGKMEKDVEFGTCELCMYIDDVFYNQYFVEDENGEKYIFDDGYMNYGLWENVLDDHIHNIVHFADWFSNKELPESLDEHSFWITVDEYIKTFQSNENENNDV